MTREIEQKMSEIALLLQDDQWKQLDLAAAADALYEDVAKKLSILRTNLVSLDELAQRDTFKDNPSLANERVTYQTAIANMQIYYETVLPHKVNELCRKLKKKANGQDLARRLIRTFPLIPEHSPNGRKTRKKVARRRTTVRSRAPKTSVRSRASATSYQDRKKLASGKIDSVKAGKSKRIAVKKVLKPPKRQLRHFDFGPNEPRFANRERELEFLKQESRAQFCLIYGPAGYGKTRLLARLQEEFASKSDKWAIAVLRFDQNKEACSSPKAVLSGLLKSLGARTYEGEDDPTRVDRLVGAFKHRSSSALLLFDAAEKADPFVFDWIGQDLLPSLNSRKPALNVRAFVACRWNRQLGETNTQVTKALRPISIENYRLSNFVERDLMTVIKEVTQEWDVTLDPNTNAYPLLELTRGHPKCVTSAMVELAKSGGAPELVNRRFVGETRKKLFEQHIQPIILTRILKDYDSKLLNVLRTVMTFRRVNATIIELLKNRESFQAYGFDFSPPAAPRQFLYNTLYKTGLFYRPIGGDSQSLVTDPVVRHYFAVEMQLAARDEFDALQDLARTYNLALFRGELPEPGKRLGNPNRYFVESLYHLCRQLEDPRKDQPERKRMIMEQVQVWIQYSKAEAGMSHVSDAQELVDFLKDDNEMDIPFLIDTLMGEGGFEEFKTAMTNSAKVVEEK